MPFGRHNGIQWNMRGSSAMGMIAYQAGFMRSCLSPASPVRWQSSWPKRRAIALRRRVGGDGGGTGWRLRGRRRGRGAGGRAAWQHARTPSGGDFQPALFGEGTIGVGYGSEMDAQIGGQAPYAGQVGAGWQGTLDQQGADLIDDLPVD